MKGSGSAPILCPIPEIFRQEVLNSARNVSQKTSSWSNDRDVKPGPSQVRKISVLQSDPIRVEVRRVLRNCAQQQDEPVSNLIPAAGSPIENVVFYRKSQRESEDRTSKQATITPSKTICTH